jgi:hypothetical protein
VQGARRRRNEGGGLDDAQAPEEVVHDMRLTPARRGIGIADIPRTS